MLNRKDLLLTQDTDAMGFTSKIRSTVDPDEGYTDFTVISKLQSRYAGLWDDILPNTIKSQARTVDWKVQTYASKEVKNGAACCYGQTSARNPEIGCNFGCDPFRVGRWYDIAVQVMDSDNGAHCGGLLDGPTDTQRKAVIGQVVQWIVSNDPNPLNPAVDALLDNIVRKTSTLRDELVCVSFIPLPFPLCMCSFLLILK